MQQQLLFWVCCYIIVSANIVRPSIVTETVTFDDMRLFCEKRGRTLCAPTEKTRNDSGGVQTMISRVIRGILALVLVAVIAFSVYKILGIKHDYDQANKIQDEMLVYKPKPPEPTPHMPDTPPPSVHETPTPVPFVNYDILEARENVNSDIVGWLTIPGTNIDYLFVWFGDNDFYLYRDLHKNRAAAGSIFMEARNSTDFTDFNTILYGHHMKNGSMFHNLDRFAKNDFFETHLTGTVFLADKTFTLRIFAYIVTRADDAVLYATQLDPRKGLDEHLAYIRNKARQYRDIDITETDRILTLSTCGYEFDEARVLILAKLEEI